MASLYTDRDRNIRKTWFLMFGFFLFVILAGWGISWYMGNSMILYIAVGIAILMNVFSYWYSDKLVVKMTGARPAPDEGRYSELHNIVENLAITAGLPKPKVYVMNERAPNAFATGRDPKHSLVAVTEGLLDMLNRSELEGVIAHELSHIKNRDILIGTVAVVLAGFIAILADIFLRMSIFGIGGDDNKAGGWLVLVGILLSILAPIAAKLIQLAVSRKREFLADASGALLTRYPDGLSSALLKISGYKGGIEKAGYSTAHLFIANPFEGKRKRLSKLFMTHPPVEERIEALKDY